MNDRDLDQLVARANPFGDGTVQQLSTADAERELMTEVMRSPAARRALPRRSLARRTLRRPVLLAAAAVVIVAVGAGIVATRGGGGSSAYAADARAVAEANQRLLIDEPGWKVVHVDGFTITEGEVRFQKGAQTLQVTWYPTAQYRDLYADRVHGDAKQPITLLGQAATLFTSSPTDHSTMLPPKGLNFLEIRGEGESEQAYRALLGKLHSVSVNTWLAAMPASVVKPADIHTTVDGMLADIPLPPGFDKQALYHQQPRDRYDVGAAVTGRVTCGWLDQWVAAKKSGDAQRLKQADAALASSHHWKVLIEMEASGAWPQVLWDLVDRTVKGQDPGDYRHKGGMCDY